MFMVTGSQADRAEKNKITLLKISDLNKTYVKAGKYLQMVYFIYSSIIFNKNRKFTAET